MLPTEAYLCVLIGNFDLLVRVPLMVTRKCILRDSPKSVLLPYNSQQKNIYMYITKTAKQATSKRTENENKTKQTNKQTKKQENEQQTNQRMSEQKFTKTKPIANNYNSLRTLA